MPGWHQVEIEGRHADLAFVADRGPDAKVEVGNGRRHLPAPELGVFQLADEGEGHGVDSDCAQGSAVATGAGAAATRTTIHKPTRMMAPPMSTARGQLFVERQGACDHAGNRHQQDERRHLVDAIFD